MGVAWTALNLGGAEKVALFYAISHALNTGGLFVLAGFLLENNHVREIKYYQGLIRLSPAFCVIFFIFCLISMGFPGFSGFIGEIYTIAYTFNKGRISYTIFMGIFILFNTWLTVNLLSRIVWGTPATSDLNFENIYRVYLLFPLILFSLMLGIKPSIIL